MSDMDPERSPVADPWATEIPLEPLPGMDGRFDAPFYEGRHRRVEADEPTPFNIKDYNQAIVYLNPNSTQAEKARETLVRLQAVGETIGLAVKEAQTSPSLAKTINGLYEMVTLEPKSVIITILGDGSEGLLKQAMEQMGLENPTISLPGGGENDQSAQYLSEELREHPEQILTNPDLNLLVCRVHPLLVTIALRNGTIVAAEAQGYATAGKSGEIAHRMNASFRHDPLRKLPFHLGNVYTKLGKLSMAAQVLLFAKRFSLSVNGKPPQKTTDFIAANGLQMASRLHFDQNTLFKPGARIVHARGPLHSAQILKKLCLGEATGTELAEGETINLHGTKPVWVQFDGEAVEGNILSITPARDGIYVVTDRQPEPDILAA